MERPTKNAGIAKAIEIYGTDTALAEAMGVSMPLVNLVRRGLKPVSVNFAMRASVATGIHPAEFLPGYQFPTAVNVAFARARRRAKAPSLGES